ncbi:MAG: hypothetical protein KDI98_05215 [Hyphomicrobiaceae bacterium]|nr:hypothetical protein [Hyphomicrobiaceae bacterium]
MGAANRACSLLFALSLFAVSGAPAASQDAGDGASEGWLREYLLLIGSRSYAESYRLINAHRGEDLFADQHISYHLMLGRGVPRDVCEAVHLLEPYYPQEYNQIRSSLNIIYNNSWASVASIEGSGAASYELAAQYLWMSNRRAHDYAGQQRFQISQAYTHFTRAVHFGYEEAQGHVDNLVARHPWLLNIDVDLSTRPIVCGVR